MTPAATLAITPADRALGRADVEAALTGHRPLIDRKPKQRRPATDSTIALARRLERLARAALPEALRHLRREPGEVWLLANDPERAESIDANHLGRGMAPFDPADATDVRRVARNDSMRERRRVTSAGNARRFGAGGAAGEVDVAASDCASAPADELIEAAQTLLALQVAGRIDAGWHQLQALPATCGEDTDDAEALPVAAAAERAGRSLRTIQTRMQDRHDVERAGQLVLPGVPRTRDVYRARQPKKAA